MIKAGGVGVALRSMQPGMVGGYQSPSSSRPPCANIPSVKRGSWIVRLRGFSGGGGVVRDSGRKLEYILLNVILSAFSR